MIIALDYDGTYTRDPDLWDRFIADCQRHSHIVICVTQRPWAPDRQRERVPCSLLRDEEGHITKDPIPVICAGDRFKLDAARDAGYHVSIWIDDMPGTVSQPASLL